MRFGPSLWERERKSKERYPNLKTSNPSTIASIFVGSLLSMVAVRDTFTRKGKSSTKRFIQASTDSCSVLSNLQLFFVLNFLSHLQEVQIPLSEATALQSDNQLRSKTETARLSQDGRGLQLLLGHHIQVPPWL